MSVVYIYHNTLLVYINGRLYTPAAWHTIYRSTPVEKNSIHQHFTRLSVILHLEQLINYACKHIHYASRVTDPSTHSACQSKYLEETYLETALLRAYITTGCISFDNDGSIYIRAEYSIISRMWEEKWKLLDWACRSVWHTGAAYSMIDQTWYVKVRSAACRSNNRTYTLSMWMLFLAFFCITDEPPSNGVTCSILAAWPPEGPHQIYRDPYKIDLISCRVTYIRRTSLAALSAGKPEIPVAIRQSAIHAKRLPAFTSFTSIFNYFQYFRVSTKYKIFTSNK